MGPSPSVGRRLLSTSAQGAGQAKRKRQARKSKARNWTVPSAPSTQPSEMWPGVWFPSSGRPKRKSELAAGGLLHWPSHQTQYLKTEMLDDKEPHPTYYRQHPITINDKLSQIFLVLFYKPLFGRKSMPQERIREGICRGWEVRVGRKPQLVFWSCPPPKNTLNALSQIIASIQSNYFNQILKWQRLAFQE